MRSDQIDIKLMTWGSIRITLDELLIALRHRLIVITYFICWAAIYPIRFRPDVPYLDIWREILIFLVSQVVVISSLPVMVAVIVRSGRRQPVPAVFISPIVFLGTILGCLTIAAGFWMFTGTLSVDVSTILVYGLLHLVLTEIVGAVVMTFFLSTVLADIRFPPAPDTTGKRLELPGSAPAREATLATDPVAVIEAQSSGSAEEGVMPENLAPRPPPIALQGAEVVIGGKMVPRHQLRIIRAAGNYLDITLRTDKLFVQATMRSVLQQMDSADGLLLHRSLWLAASEVESFQRQGVDILVHTRDGETVKTARSRQPEVLAWLKQQLIPRRGAAS